MQFYIVLMHLSSKISSCIYLWVFSSLPFLHTACISRVVGPHQVIITFSSSLFGMITHDYTLTFITFGVLCNCLLLWSNNRTRMCLSLNNAAFSVFWIFPLFQFPLCKQHFSFFFCKLSLMLQQEHGLYQWVAENVRCELWQSCP